MASAYSVNDAQAAIFLAALIFENAKHLNGKPLRVSGESIRQAMKANTIKARQLLGDGKDYEIEFKLSLD